MSRIEQSIDVDVPARVAYNQWTQFEDFPHFMQGVQSVTQIDDTHLRWVADIGGAEREWTAEITEQIPDKRIAWTSTDPDVVQSGVVTFHRLDDASCTVMLQMSFAPGDAVEKAGDILGFVRAQIKEDLQRFKEWIEERGVETGGWRGEVPEHAAGEQPPAKRAM
jgi:uncharacterized membrane protein